MKYFNDYLTSLEIKSPKIKKMKREFDYQEEVGKRKLNKPKRLNSKRQENF